MKRKESLKERRAIKKNRRLHPQFPVTRCGQTQKKRVKSSKRYSLKNITGSSTRPERAQRISARFFLPLSLPSSLSFLFFLRLTPPFANNCLARYLRAKDCRHPFRTRTKRGVSSLNTTSRYEREDDARILPRVPP